MEERLDYIEIVRELNVELYEIHNEEYQSFSYMSNGYYDAVYFEEHVLWDSENDNREFIEETNDYEPFLPFIKREFNNWVDKLNSLKF